jgi:hypothetical protein
MSKKLLLVGLGLIVFCLLTAAGKGLVPAVPSSLLLCAARDLPKLLGSDGTKLRNVSAVNAKADDHAGNVGTKARPADDSCPVSTRRHSANNCRSEHPRRLDFHGSVTAGRSRFGRRSLAFSRSLASRQWTDV